MCGVFLGSSCAFRMSQNLNWTIPIPEKVPSNGSKDVGSGGNKEEKEVPKGFDPKKEESNVGQELTGRRDRDDDGDDVITTSPSFPFLPLLPAASAATGSDDHHHDLVSNSLEQVVDDGDPFTKRRSQEKKSRKGVVNVPSGSKEKKKRKMQEEDEAKKRPENEHSDSPSLLLSGRKSSESSSKSSEEGIKRGTFQVAQITDIHFDPYFSPGTRSDCGEPVCCRNVNGPASTLASMAGIWGDYTDCDTPYFTIDSALKQVSNAHPNVRFFLPNLTLTLSTLSTIFGPHHYHQRTLLECTERWERREKTLNRK